MFLSEQQDAARRSAMLNEPLKTLAHRADDGGEVASTLTDLRMRVEELDPAGVDFEAGWLMRMVGKIPGVGSPVKRYLHPLRVGIDCYRRHYPLAGKWERAAEARQLNAVRGPKADASVG